MHYQDGFKVRPLGTSFINQLTEGLRREFGVTGYLDVIGLGGGNMRLDQCGLWEATLD